MDHSASLTLNIIIATAPRPNRLSRRSECFFHNLTLNGVSLWNKNSICHHFVTGSSYVSIQCVGYFTLSNINDVKESICMMYYPCWGWRDICLQRLQKDPKILGLKRNIFRKRIRCSTGVPNLSLPDSVPKAFPSYFTFLGVTKK